MSKLSIVILLILSLTACTNANEQGKGDDSNQTKPLNTSVSKANEMSLTNNHIAVRATEKISKYEEINRVISIHNDMELIVGFNVEKFEEFNVKKIEERVKKDLKDEFPTEQITVSHDQKILMELEKLVNEQEKLSEKEIKKRMQKIKSLSKEITLL